MKKTPIEVNAESIIHEAAILFFNRGYKNTSLQEVANILNVTRPAIYHYFKSKEEIILAIIDDVITKTETYLTELIEQREPEYIKFQKLVKNHILLILTNKVKMGIFFEEQKSLPEEMTNKTQKTIDQYYDTAERWFVEGIEKGYFIDVDPTIAVQTILGSCNWAYKWYSPDGPLNKNELAQMMSNILLQGYLNKG